MKRLLYEVSLQLFCDDTTGEWGVCPKQCVDPDSGFNSFWGGQGIFHDVWEHYFEKQHKYFMGDCAMNYAGEMTAMGAMYYYLETLGVSNRLNNEYQRFHGPAESAAREVSGMLMEAVTYGYMSFGSTLESCLPPQHGDDGTHYLDKAVRDHYNQIMDCNSKETSPEDIERSKELKKSITLRKMLDHHRYGYKLAKRNVPDNVKNQNTLYEFRGFWDDFTKHNGAEQLYQVGFTHINVSVFREKDIVSWSATLQNVDPQQNIVITEPDFYYAELTTTFSEEESE